MRLPEGRSRPMGTGNAPAKPRRQLFEVLSDYGLRPKAGRQGGRNCEGETLGAVHPPRKMLLVACLGTARELLTPL